jgi:recombinational DNA repair protein (RecF pathway)
MHVTECVFFKRTGVGEQEFVYELWSREFGKIRAFAKEKKVEARADVGSVIQANIETKGEKNRLVSFKLRKNVSSDAMDYEAAVSFLKTVSALSKSLPEGIPNRSLFESYVEALPFFESTDNSKTVAAFLTKLAKALGTYCVPENASPLLRKFERAVERYDLATVSKMKGVDPPLVREAVLAAELALARYHF